jgi:hypothetical protein
MLNQQGELILSPYIKLYDVVVPKENQLRKIVTIQSASNNNR